MTKIISEKRIPKLIDLLKKRYEVFAPIRQPPEAGLARGGRRTGGEVVFAPVGGKSTLVLDYQTTILPPKQFFLPPREELFVVEKGKVTEPTPPAPYRTSHRVPSSALVLQHSGMGFVIFGLNLTDLAGICRLDEIMSREPADSFYLNRREKAILIAVSDKEVGIPPGGDLILEKVGEVYRAIALTKAGQKIVDLPVFRQEAEGRRQKARSRKQTKPSKLEEMLLDSELLARAIEWSRENYPQIWERLGKICLGCGICTYVCPLCYCFEIEDRVTLEGSKCISCLPRDPSKARILRGRYWSACTLPGFTTVAGGHNFRPTLKDRYFNWYYHKFVRAYKEFGQAQCVACGRCQKYCPAGIDIEKVLEEVVAEFQKAHPVREF